MREGLEHGSERLTRWPTADGGQVVKCELWQYIHVRRYCTCLLHQGHDGGNASRAEGCVIRAWR